MSLFQKGCCQLSSLQFRLPSFSYSFWTRSQKLLNSLKLLIWRRTWTLEAKRVSYLELCYLPTYRNSLSPEMSSYPYSWILYLRPFSLPYSSFSWSFSLFPPPKASFLHKGPYKSCCQTIASWILRVVSPLPLARLAVSGIILSSSTSLPWFGQQWVSCKQSTLRIFSHRQSRSGQSCWSLSCSSSSGTV